MSTTMNLTPEKLAERVAAADNWVRIAQNESLAERPAHALEAMFGAYKELSALIEPLKTDLPAAVEEIKSLRAQLSAANVEREHALGVSAFARQEADTLRQQLAEAKGDLRVLKTNSEAVIDHLKEQVRKANAASGEYHRVMNLLRNTKMGHGQCQPRSRKACTHCNAQDELDKLIADYKGAPIRAAMEGSRTK